MFAENPKNYNIYSIGGRDYGASLSVEPLVRDGSESVIAGDGIGDVRHGGGPEIVFDRIREGAFSNIFKCDSCRSFAALCVLSDLPDTRAYDRVLVERVCALLTRVDGFSEELSLVRNALMHSMTGNTPMEIECVVCDSGWEDCLCRCRNRSLHAANGNSVEEKNQMDVKGDEGGAADGFSNDEVVVAQAEVLALQTSQDLVLQQWFATRQARYLARVAGRLAAGFSEAEAEGRNAKMHASNGNTDFESCFNSGPSDAIMGSAAALLVGGAITLVVNEWNSLFTSPMPPIIPTGVREVEALQRNSLVHAINGNTSLLSLALSDDVKSTSGSGSIGTASSSSLGESKGSVSGMGERVKTSLGVARMLDAFVDRIPKKNSSSDISTFLTLWHAGIRPHRMVLGDTDYQVCPAEPILVMPAVRVIAAVEYPIHAPSWRFEPRVWAVPGTKVSPSAAFSAGLALGSGIGDASTAASMLRTNITAYSPQVGATFVGAVGAAVLDGVDTSMLVPIFNIMCLLGSMVPGMDRSGDSLIESIAFYPTNFATASEPLTIGPVVSVYPVDVRTDFAATPINAKVITIARYADLLKRTVTGVQPGWDLGFHGLSGNDGVAVVPLRGTQLDVVGPSVVSVMSRMNSPMFDWVIEGEWKNAGDVNDASLFYGRNTVAGVAVNGPRYKVLFVLVDYQNTSLTPVFNFNGIVIPASAPSAGSDIAAAGVTNVSNAFLNWAVSPQANRLVDIERAMGTWAETGSMGDFQAAFTKFSEVVGCGAQRASLWSPNGALTISEWCVTSALAATGTPIPNATVLGAVNTSNISAGKWHAVTSALGVCASKSMANGLAKPAPAGYLPRTMSVFDVASSARLVFSNDRMRSVPSWSDLMMSAVECNKRIMAATDLEFERVGLPLGCLFYASRPKYRELLGRFSQTAQQVATLVSGGQWNISFAPNGNDSDIAGYLDNYVNTTSIAVTCASRLCPLEISFLYPDSPMVSKSDSVGFTDQKYDTVIIGGAVVDSFRDLNMINSRGVDNSSRIRTLLSACAWTLPGLDLSRFVTCAENPTLDREQVRFGTSSSDCSALIARQSAVVANFVQSFVVDFVPIAAPNLPLFTMIRGSALVARKLQVVNLRYVIASKGNPGRMVSYPDELVSMPFASGTDSSSVDADALDAMFAGLGGA